MTLEPRSLLLLLGFYLFDLLLGQAYQYGMYFSSAMNSFETSIRLFYVELEINVSQARRIFLYSCYHHLLF